MNFDNSEEIYKPIPSINILNDLYLSNEAFFGQSSPLSLILKTFAKDIKDLIGTENDKKNFKDKKYVNSIKELCDNFGSKLSEELNVDKTTIVIVLDRSINAYCIPLITCFDNRPLDKDGNPINGKVDLDKYADLENIVQTKTGYKFKNPKNKLLLISINVGLIWNSSEDEIAGIICHEVGHCFQQAIFGSYKNYSDLMYMTEIKKLSTRFDTFSSAPTNPLSIFFKLFTPLPFFGKIMMATMLKISNPSLLDSSFFPKLGLYIYSFLHGRILKEKTFKMQDKLDKIDNDKLSRDETVKLDAQSIGMNVNREKEFVDIQKDAIDDYKTVNIYKKEAEATTKLQNCKKYINDFITALWYDINNKQTNFLRVISLSKYTQDKQSKLIFYKKYEFFADIFASSYGFGPVLYQNLTKTETDTNNYITNVAFSKCLFKVPIIKAFALYSNYNRMRDIEIIDEHGGAYERASAIYTNLMYELKNNPDLTLSQKKDIQNDINLLKTIDDNYYKDNAKKGFLYKLYNKMLKKRQTSYNSDVEEMILQPMAEVIKE